MSPTVPATEKQPHSMRLLQHTLLLGWYSAGDEQCWLPSNMKLGIEVHQTRSYYLSESEGPLGAFFCKFQVCFLLSSLWRGLSLSTLQ